MHQPCDVPHTGRRSAPGPTFLSAATHASHYASHTLSVSQILAHNFEDLMVTYASIFTGPQAQIPSSPYQQGLGLVRGYPSLSPAWRISPRSIMLEDVESVSTTLFCCPCMDYSFRLLFAFVSMYRSRKAQFFSAGLQEQSVQEELTPFPSSPTAFRLLSHNLTPIFTPR